MPRISPTARCCAASTSRLARARCWRSSGVRVPARRRSCDWTGLDRAFAGRIDVEGPIGMVFQEPRLLPWRRTIENVALALPGSPRLPDNVRRAADALAQVGLAGEADTFPRALSGGMARRVALARALVIRPRLMLLDEPFASLDEATADQLRQMVAELWQQHRVSVVLVTHDVGSTDPRRPHHPHRGAAGNNRRRCHIRHTPWRAK